jgi:RNA polymerase subunit RPABC4/transcription elongation factor Spt4
MSVQRLLVEFVILGLLCSGCASCRLAPPPQELCFLDTSNPASLEWYALCLNTQNPTEKIRILTEMDKYVCRSPEDEQLLEEWIKRILMRQDRSGTVQKQQLPLAQFLERIYGRN